MVINIEILKTVLKETLREVLREDAPKCTSESDRVLNAKEAAAYLHIKLSTLYEKTSARCIPHIKQGNRVFFYLEELKQWRKKGKVLTDDELRDEAATYTIRNQKQAI